MSHPKNYEVILKETIPGLGDLGEVVRVRTGYARNYLLPRGLALAASATTKAQVEHEQRLITAKIKRLMIDAEAVAKTMKGLVLEVSKKAGREGRLFGSVTGMDIEAALKSKGYGIHRKQVLSAQPIKSLGDHQVQVKLHPQITVSIGIHVVVAEADEEHPFAAAEGAAPARKAGSEAESSPNEGSGEAPPQAE